VSLPPLPSLSNSNRLWAPVPYPLPLPHHQTSANFHQLQSLLQHSGFLIIPPSKSPLISLSHLHLSITSVSLWPTHHHTLSDHHLISDPPPLGTQSPSIVHMVHYTFHTGSSIHQFHWRERLEMAHLEVFWRR
jgi:hypothetical protein